MNRQHERGVGQGGSPGGILESVFSCCGCQQRRACPVKL